MLTLRGNGQQARCPSFLMPIKFPFPHFLRVADAVKEDVLANPIEVAFLGAIAVVALAQSLAHLIKQCRHSGNLTPDTGSPKLIRASMA